MAVALSAEQRVSLRMQLGEGICWAPQVGAFLWVDIHRARVYQHTLASAVLAYWDLPYKIGWLIPTDAKQRYVAGLKSGFAYLNLDPSDAAIEWIFKPFGDDGSDMRLNDAKIDASRHIWAGSLKDDDETEPAGRLFRLAPGGEVTTVDEGYCVPNGPAISPDGSLFLHTDSLKRTIFAFDIDPVRGRLANKRVWKTWPAHEGYPDGMNFDADGCVWVAHWGAGMVSRFSREGELMSRVEIPASNVTNVAFGGDALDRLWVTTAVQGMSSEELDRQPAAGSVFEIMGHGTRGVAGSTYPSRS